MKKFFLDLGLAFVFTYVILTTIVLLIAMLIGLGGSFIEWNMTPFYDMWDELYGDAESLRTGILTFFVLSLIISFFVAANKQSD